MSLGALEADLSILRCIAQRFPYTVLHCEVENNSINGRLIPTARIGGDTRVAQTSLESAEVGLVDVGIGVEIGVGTGWFQVPDLGAGPTGQERIEVVMVDAAVAVEIAGNEARATDDIHRRANHRARTRITSIGHAITVVVRARSAWGHEPRRRERRGLHEVQ